MKNCKGFFEKLCDKKKLNNEEKLNIKKPFIIMHGAQIWLCKLGLYAKMKEIIILNVKQIDKCWRDNCEIGRNRESFIITEI